MNIENIYQAVESKIGDKLDEYEKREIYDHVVNKKPAKYHGGSEDLLYVGCKEGYNIVRNFFINHDGVISSKTGKISREPKSELMIYMNPKI